MDAVTLGERVSFTSNPSARDNSLPFQVCAWSWEISELHAETSCLLCANLGFSNATRQPAAVEWHSHLDCTINTPPIKGVAQ
jgi:hypothetical protein